MSANILRMCQFPILHISRIASSFSWLKDVIDFGCADDGMMLADVNDDYDDNWGPCTGCKSTGGSYSRRTKTHHHRASFILGTLCLTCIILLHHSHSE